MKSVKKVTYGFFGMNKRVKGRIIMTRHGQSEWNDMNRWTGWTDIKLSDKGDNEIFM
jgi:hypothetical protein